MTINTTLFCKVQSLFLKFLYLKKKLKNEASQNSRFLSNSIWDKYSACILSALTFQF